MTPLASKVLKQYVRPDLVVRNSSEEAAQLSLRMAALAVLNGSCFECSDIVDLAQGFGEKHFPQHVSKDLMFLPAKACWFEWRDSTGAHHALEVFDIDADQGCVSARAVHFDMSGKLPPFVDPHKHPGPGLMFAKSRNVEVGAASDWGWSGFLAGLLTIINQPSGVMRQSVPAHKGLQKALRKKGLLTDPRSGRGQNLCSSALDDLAEVRAKLFGPVVLNVTILYGLTFVLQTGSSCARISEVIRRSALGANPMRCGPDGRAARHDTA